MSRWDHYTIDPVVPSAIVPIIFRSPALLSLFIFSKLSLFVWLYPSTTTGWRPGSLLSWPSLLYTPRHQRSFPLLLWYQNHRRFEGVRSVFSSLVPSCTLYGRCSLLYLSSIIVLPRILMSGVSIYTTCVNYKIRPYYSLHDFQSTKIIYNMYTRLPFQHSSLQDVINNTATFHSSLKALLKILR